MTQSYQTLPESSIYATVNYIPLDPAPAGPDCIGGTSPYHMGRYYPWTYGVSYPVFRFFVFESVSHRGQFDHV